MKRFLILFIFLFILRNGFCQQFGGQLLGNDAFQLSPTYGDLLMRRYIDNDLTWKRALVPTANQLILNCGGDFSLGTSIQGSNVFVEGNLCVGGGNPTSYKLDVNGNLKIGTTTDGSIFHLYGKPNVSWGYLIDNTQQNALVIRSQYEGSRIFSIDPFGSVGIGTSSPLAPLHIQNTDNTYGAILAQASETPFQLYTKTITTQPVDVASFRVGMKYGNDENNGFITFYRGQDTYGGFLGFSTNGQERIRIDRDGNVGIGVSSFSHKLEVNGTIRAKEIRVDAENWPDYVFSDNYHLLGLSEVENFISEIKHLPDMPEASQMEKEGVNLSEMNKLLLQKIEELTLYSIQQNKTIESLIKVLDQQNSRIEKLEQN